MATPGKQGPSTAELLLENEFQRVCKRGRHYLTLAELQEFQIKSTTIPVELNHLGVLWALDRDHDGKVGLHDLVAFAEFCTQHSREAMYQSHQTAMQLKGYFFLGLWKDIVGEKGKQDFTSWLVSLFTENSLEKRRFWRHGGQLYLHIDCIEAIYRLLDIDDTVELNLQDFVDLLQRAGEESGDVMNIHDVELDDWVPVSTLYDFAVGIYQGACSILTDVCPLEHGSTNDVLSQSNI